jgi:hypothetical protein
MKKCSRCGKEFPLDYFYPSKNTNDRLKGRCKKCHYLESRDYQKKWYKKNEERMKKLAREKTLNLTDEEFSKRKDYQKKWQEKRQIKFLIKYGISHRVICDYGLKEVVYIYKKYKFCCALCYSKKILCIHHKDFKGKRIKNIINKNVNNNTENLILLCHSCHRKVHGTKNKIIIN